MSKKYILIALSASLLLCSCKKEIVEISAPVLEQKIPDTGLEMPWFEGQDVTFEVFSAPDAPFDYMISYKYEASDFCNPERGSYAPLEYHFKDGNIPQPYTLERLKSARRDNCTLHYLGVYLCDYMESDISEEALNVLRQHFELERQAGTKVILRHAYSWNNKWPAMEPELKWILRHMEQLSPIWNEYKDVIYVFQAGFIGVYGEWHTLTNITTNEQKGELVKKYLDLTPKDRQIAMRTPGHKRLVLKYINGENYANRDTITAATAFNDSYNSRMGSHNDCVFVNGSDGGTFTSGQDIRMIRNDSNYTSNGGESCFQDDYTYCECVYSNNHLRRFHWSYLSNHFAIADFWKGEGCNRDLVSRIGYRLVLNGSAFYGDFTAGGDFLMKICLTNYGFASLINERNIEIIIQAEDDPTDKYMIVSEKDPRDWKGCHHYEWHERFILPETLRAGVNYTIYLNLPDISDTLHDNPLYSVRFANKGVWDETTGYNRLAAFRAE